MPVPVQYGSRVNLNVGNFSASGHQFFPHLTATASGLVFAAWNSGAQHQAGYFSTSGFSATVASSTFTRANEVGSGGGNVDVAALSDGRVAMVYQFGVDLSANVTVQLINQDGTYGAAKTQEIAGFQGSVAVDVSTTDNIVIVNTGVSSTTRDIFRSSYSSSLTEILAPDEITAAAVSPTGSQGEPDVARLGDGRFIAVWKDNDTDRVMGTFLLSGGARSTTILTLANDAPPVFGNQNYSVAVTALANGGFAIAFDSDEGGADIVYRLFDSSGTPTTGLSTISGLGNYSPAILGLPDGRIVVVASSTSALNGQLINANGTLDGGQFVIDTGVGENQPSITLLPDGRFAVAYSIGGVTGGVDRDIVMKIFDPRIAGVTINGTLKDDHYVGSTFIDSLNGSNGNDLLDTGNGADFATGGLGNDVLLGESLTANGLTFGSGVYTRVANQPNTTFGSAADISNLWSVAPGINVAGSTVIPHVTINAAGNDVAPASHFYRVNLIAGQAVFFDIDGTDVDLGMRLFDPAGNVVASGDDSAIAIGAGGSPNTNTPYIAHVAAASGVYTIQIAKRASGAPLNNNLVLSDLDGVASYQLNVSVANTVASGDVDSLSGNDGSDVLIGGGGNDILDGGVDADILLGGAGNDRFIFNGDVVSGEDIQGGLGTDELYINTTTNFAVGTFWAIPTSMEVITLNSGAQATFYANHFGPGRIANNVLLKDAGTGTNTLFVTMSTAATFNASAFQFDASWDTSDFLQITGDEGSESIVGSSRGDRVFGGEGSDYLYGRAGDDTVQGDDGDDRLFGDAGLDTLSGGAGVDQIQGGADNDTINGDGEDDYLYGDDGNDVIVGGSGNDKVYGGTGNDTITGGIGVDVLQGQSGVDTIYGDADADYLYGGDDADFLYGGAGVDVIDGGTGNDTVYGGDDGDVVYGQTGVDVVHGEGGNDYVYGGDDADYLYGEAGVDVLLGQLGDDRLYGGTEIDYLYGGDGTDQLFGEAGNDTLRGEAGADYLDGGVGVDIMFGGAGDDRFLIASHSGYKYLQDFVAGGTEDRIQLSGSGLTTFAQLKPFMSQAGADVVIALHADTTIRLTGVTLGNLTAGDFVFS